MGHHTYRVLRIEVFEEARPGNLTERLRAAGLHWAHEVPPATFRDSETANFAFVVLGENEDVPPAREALAVGWVLGRIGMPSELKVRYWHEPELVELAEVVEVLHG